MFSKHSIIEYAVFAVSLLPIVFGCPSIIMWMLGGIAGIFCNDIANKICSKK